MGNAKPLAFEPLPTYGDLMTVTEFKEAVEAGSFIDYDGHGDLATSSEVSNLSVCPSDLEGGFEFPSWATHVVWYNR